MRSRWAVVGLVGSLALLVGALVALLLGSGGTVGADLPRVTAVEASGQGTVDEPSAASSSTGVPGSGAPIPIVDATTIPAPDERTPPRRLEIPSLGLSMPIRATGVLDDGQMELPENPDRIGWYRFGPSPGDRRGSVVLGGHVDSVRYGVGPLAALSGVEQSAEVVVTSAEGEPITYRVRDVQRISKAALPTEQLFDPESRARLVIVTCGGRYLPEAGGYEDNIVVIAEPVRS